MSTAHLLESLSELGVNLDVTDNGKLRIVSSQDFINTPEFERLKNSKAEVVSHLNHQKAENLVSSLKLREDRIFVHKCLIGIYWVFWSFRSSALVLSDPRFRFYSIT